MQYFSFHTHSSFCDGKASIEEVCKSAIKQGIKAIGFSSHAPVAFKTEWAMKMEDLSDYVAEVERCKKLFAGQLEIYRSLETDFIAHDKSIPFDVVREMAKLDYIIGSVHLVNNPEKDDAIWFLDGPSINYDNGINNIFDGDAQRAVIAYYQQMQAMVKTQKPDMIAHMDKVVMNNKGRYFKESDVWYQQIMEETLRIIADYSTIIEINTRGIYRGKYHTWFPCESVIKQCAELDIPLTISVDAHHPDELTSGFDDALNALKKYGVKCISVFEAGKWKQKDIKDILV